MVQPGARTHFSMLYSGKASRGSWCFFPCHHISLSCLQPSWSLLFLCLELNLLRFSTEDPWEGIWSLCRQPRIRFSPQTPSSNPTTCHGRQCSQVLVLKKGTHSFGHHSAHWQ